MCPLPHPLAPGVPTAADAAADDRAAPSDFDIVRDGREHPELEQWRANVGAPLALDLAPPAPPQFAGVDVLSWNLAIGDARLGELLERLRAGEWGGAGTDPGRPLVVLAQEAYRTDATVPGALRSAHHGGQKRARGERRSIAEVAERYGLSLRYVASMRNGPAPSDRGNAVLSSVAIGRARAFSLPHVRQHRVAVAAELAGLPGFAFVSAHLDTGGRLRAESRWMTGYGAGRAAQAAELARRVLAAEVYGDVVVGGDLNTPLGVRDPAYLSLIRAGLVPARWRYGFRPTFRAPAGVRFHLDHVLYHSADARIRSVEVVRLDDPAARGAAARPFGSDHHPLLARVELAQVAAEPGG
jgi:endonuclease/exonuclease/phosphatase family metal-dependent hydrolase